MVRVLLVDDDATLRGRVCRLLAETMSGTQVEVSATADDGLARGLSEPWSAIILDIRLGAASGLDVLVHLRARRPETPVLIFSALPRDPYAFEAGRAGAAAYVQKERADEDLVATLQVVMARGAAR